MFVSLILHEIAHIAVALFQDVKLNSIKIFPVGINAVLNVNSEKKVNTLFINVSGPLMNILLAAVFIIIDSYYLKNSDNMRFFIYVNISLAVFNLFPLLPLDGGKILKDMLSCRIGLFKASKYTGRICRVASLVMIVVGAVQFATSGYNFSIMLIGGYIFYSLKYESTEVSLMNIKNLVYRRSRILRKGIYPGRELVAMRTMRLGDIIRNMDFDRFHIIYVLDEEMKLVRIFTEQEIIENMIKYSSDISFENLMKELNQSLQ